MDALKLLFTTQISRNIMTNPTEKSLIEQMRITEFEIENRKAIISFTDEDAVLLTGCKKLVERHIEEIVNSFYIQQTKIPEVALIIGDSGTLERLKTAQRRYIIDLFNGLYDLEYVNNRCRIGLVHKRIGVEPKLYLSGVLYLKDILCTVIEEKLDNSVKSKDVIAALDKLFMFDITLVFETYIRSLVAEIESSKNKTDSYAMALEDKVRARTKQLDELSKIDPLTGLLNTRLLQATLTKVLRDAEHQSKSLSAVYIDVNDLKIVNDTQGHQRGDEILQNVGHAISGCARPEDFCFRYGGDEFFVLLSNCTEKQAHEIYIASLERRMRELNISLSIGVAQTGPNSFVNEAMLIKLADENMYLAKKKHKENKLEVIKT